MRLHRMTRRRWMIAVAVGVIGSLVYRYSTFKTLAAYHHSKTTWCISLTSRGCVHEDCNGRVMTGAEVKASPWHKKVSGIYERAAARPWLPVETIPPEP